MKRLPHEMGVVSMYNSIFINRVSKMVLINLSLVKVATTLLILSFFSFRVHSYTTTDEYFSSAEKGAIISYCHEFCNLSYLFDNIKHVHTMFVPRDSNYYAYHIPLLNTNANVVQSIERGAGNLRSRTKTENKSDCEFDINVVYFLLRTCLVCYFYFYM